jgi:hypothetical protein
MMGSAREFFHPAFQKLDRAEHHINDLNGQMEAYFAEHPLRLMTRGEPDAARETHFIKEKKPLPAVLPLVIGDAVHNIRSALDLFAFLMVGPNAKKPDSVQFPFAKGAKSFESTLVNRETKLAGEEVVKIITAFQPYGDGNSLLYAIHALDIIDKHKTIVPAYSSVMITGQEFYRLWPIPEARTAPGAIFEPGSSLVVRHRQPKTRNERRANRRNIRSGEYERDFQPTFVLTFGDGPCEGLAIVPTLVEMIALSRSIIMRAGGAFLAQRSS